MRVLKLVMSSPKIGPTEPEARFRAVPGAYTVAGHPWSSAWTDLPPPRAVKVRLATGANSAIRPAA